MLLKKLWPAIAWALFILIITGMPGEYIPSVTSFWDWLSPDKIVHVGVFALLTFLILQGLMQQYLHSNRRYLFVIGAVGFSLLYGMTTEILQATVFTGRDGNAYDFYADGIGAICGWVLFELVYQKKIRTFTNTNKD